MARSRAGEPPTDKPAAGRRESDAEEAERLARVAGQDPWGEAEDQPDHRENEVYLQQDPPPSAPRPD